MDPLLGLQELLGTGHKVSWSALNSHFPVQRTNPGNVYQRFSVSLAL